MPPTADLAADGHFGRMSAPGVEAIASIVVLAIGLVAAIEDLWIHRLRDRWSLSILGVTLVGVGMVSVTEGSGVDLAAMLVGVVAYAGVPLLLHLWSPAGIGFGDIKYSAALGAFLGTLHGPVTIVWGFVLAGLATVVLRLALRDGGERTPFGPGLFLGAVVLVAVQL